VADLEENGLELGDQIMTPLFLPNQRFSALILSTEVKTAKM